MQRNDLLYAYGENINIAIIQNSMEVPQKTKNRIIIC
jgi:hypothetical protein